MRVVDIICRRQNTENEEVKKTDRLEGFKRGLSWGLE